MIELICSYCLCLSIALQNNGNCHRCATDVSQDEVMRAVKAMKEPEEFMAISCFPKSSKSPIDFAGKMGAIVSKGKK